MKILKQASGWGWGPEKPFQRREHLSWDRNEEVEAAMGTASTKSLEKEELVYPGLEEGPGSVVQMRLAVIPVPFQESGSLEPGKYPF